MPTPAEICEVIINSVEQTCETFFITDTDGVILYVNPAFEKLTGYSSAEVLGKTPNILKSGEHPRAFYAEMWAALKAGGRWTGRLTNRRKDGTLYEEELRICPIKDPHGNLKYFFTLRHDTTRETELEAQLNQSQKMESLGLLTGQVAHDFNNLLTVIIGSMELIGEDLKPGSVSSKLAQEILRSSREYASLIKQLMMFTRRSETNPVPIIVNDPLNEIKILLDSLLGRNISVVYSLAETLKPVKIDAEHFKQAIMNLMVNAKDAIAAKGAISVTTRAAGPKNLPPSVPETEYSVIELADTGPGIPPEVLPRIFEPFFTTKPKGKGTGLGLSTVYGIVLQAHGYVFAANRPGGGAVFTIYLPAVNS